MAKNAISKISNAFSAGSGGGNFEQQIQAVFLLSLLVDGFCPAMKEQIKRVCFQAKHLGYDVDDLVVFTVMGKNEGKLLCQIKHSFKASEREKVFQEVICAAWSDFNKENFDKDNDRIALATAQIAIQTQKALRFFLILACTIYILASSCRIPNGMYGAMRGWELATPSYSIGVGNGVFLTVTKYAANSTKCVKIVIIVLS